MNFSEVDFLILGVQVCVHTVSGTCRRQKSQPGKTFRVVSVTRWPLRRSSYELSIFRFEV